jgi:hypothetical protein
VLDAPGGRAPTTSGAAGRAGRKQRSCRSCNGSTHAAGNVTGIKCAAGLVCAIVPCARDTLSTVLYTVLYKLIAKPSKAIIQSSCAVLKNRK